MELARIETTKLTKYTKDVYRKDAKMQGRKD